MRSATELLPGCDHHNYCHEQGKIDLIRIMFLQTVCSLNLFMPSKQPPVWELIAWVSIISQSEDKFEEAKIIQDMKYTELRNQT